MRVKTRLASSKYLSEYTQLLQRTYEDAYVDESLGLTKDCFSKEIFASPDTQKYLKSHLVINDKQKTWLAFIDSKLIGSITCIYKDRKEAELTGFYVALEHQGKGIGRRLYRNAIKFASGRDLVLDIYSHNKRTIDMYKKWGWKLDKTKGNRGYFFRHWPEWPAGLRAKCLYMRLSIKHVLTSSIAGSF